MARKSRARAEALRQRLRAERQLAVVGAAPSAAISPEPAVSIVPAPVPNNAAPNATPLAILREVVIDDVKKSECRSATARNFMAGQGLRRGLLDVFRADQAARVKAQPVSK
jgi:hypothetical protein